MSQYLPSDNDVLAATLLNVVPKILRSLNADVPLQEEATETSASLREVSELRATPGQLTLLGILVEHKRCMMQKLAEHLAVTPPTVTAMVKRLLVQGYVERCRDDTDWRTVWVMPTERGCRAVDAYNRARLFSLQRRLAQLSSNERQKLIDALPALSHLIDV